MGEKKKKKKKKGSGFNQEHCPVPTLHVVAQTIGKGRDASGNKQVEDWKVNQDCVFQFKLILELANNLQHLYNIPSQLKRSRGRMSKSRRQTSLADRIQIGQMGQS